MSRIPEAIAEGFPHLLLNLVLQAMVPEREEEKEKKEHHSDMGVMRF